MQKLPYFLALFSLAAGSLQYGIMWRDKATNLTFGQTPLTHAEVPERCARALRLGVVLERSHVRDADGRLLHD